MTQTQRGKRAPAKKAPAAKKSTTKKVAAKKAPTQATPRTIVAPSTVFEDSPATELSAVAPVTSPAYDRSVEAGRSARRYIAPVIVTVLLLLAMTQLIALGDQENGGPPRMGAFAGDVPGTLYLPGEELDGDDIFPQPKPEGQRPALIIMGHGYSSDQQGLSTMARSLARAGYATLTFDFRGHGMNRNRFAGNIRDDVKAVVDWAQTSPYVDPERIAVLGHSMGAGAAMDWATLDDRVAALIPVSGWESPNDVHTPPNVLFVIASGDPGYTHDNMEATADTFRARQGTKVDYVEISGTNHLSVVSDGRTFDAITGFLDEAFGTPTERLATGRDDPRRATALRYALICVALFAFIGRLAGRAVKPLASNTAPGAWLLLAGASLLTLPLLATGGFWILPIGSGQQVAIASLFAAAVLWSVRYFARTGALTGPVANWVGDGPWLPFRSVAVPGILAGLAMFVLLAPAGVITHATVPNFERLVYWAILTAALVPFFAAFEAIVRRGNTWAALGLGLLGRLLLLAVLQIGLGIGALPGVLGLVVPLLAVQYIVLEIFAAGAWSKGRNAAVIAIAESIVIAWVSVMFSPIG
jgi:dienelactone hydrolase